MRIYHFIAALIWRIVTLCAYCINADQFALWAAFHVLLHDEQTI